MSSFRFFDKKTEIKLDSDVRVILLPEKIENREKLFAFFIASSPDREKVTCEIYYKNELVAEIPQETEERVIEIYPSASGSVWQIPLAQLLQALVEAEKFLLGNAA